MDPQVSQQVEQKLREQWQQVSYEILQRFPTVSLSDIDSARSVDDLCRRIADKAHYSDRFVETQIHELALVGGGGQPSQFGQQSSQQPQQFGRQQGQTTS